MLEAAFWGFVGGVALLIGAGVALTFRVPPRVVAGVMAFGAGVLISAASFDLTEEALETAGGATTAGGLAAGALTFYAVSTAIKGSGAVPIVVGAILDGIPESAAIGITLLEGGGVGTAMVVAVFISNLPEALAASSELRDKLGGRRLLALWGATALACAAAAALGYGALEGAGGDALGFINAFAAGAIITMLADSMVPQAFEHSRRSLTTGLIVTLGFALAALLSAQGA